MGPAHWPFLRESNSHARYTSAAAEAETAEEGRADESRKKMEAIVEQIQLLQAQIATMQQQFQLQQQQMQQQMQQQAAQAAQPMQVEAEEEGNEDDEEEGDEQVQWGDMLPPRGMIASQPEAVCLSSMLAEPPPLDRLREAENGTTIYTAEPQTPSARKHPIDQKLHTMQKKVETIMHLHIHHFETGDRDNKAIGLSAALARSVWEDLNQQRRALLAGKQAFKLDPRKDDIKPRLLSKEEEKKVRQTPKPPQQRGRPFWRNDNQQTSGYRSNSQRYRSNSSNYRSFSQGRGKGKGKGRGRGKGKDQS